MIIHRLRLFFIVKLPFLPVYHISMDADGFVRGCSTVMRYNTIPCAERKLIFSEELMDVRFKMKPGRIYIFETFKDVIKEMKTFRINNTRIAVVKKNCLFPILFIIRTENYLATNGDIVLFVQKTLHQKEARANFLNTGKFHIVFF